MSLSTGNRGSRGLLWLLAAWLLCSTVLVAEASRSHGFMPTRTVPLARRQQNIVDESSTNPIQAAKDVQAIPYISGNSSGVTDTNDQLVQGDSDEAQLPANTAVPFIQTPNTNASAAGGWEAIPDMQGFTLNRTWEVRPGAVMPFYVTADIDYTQVKRAVITYPGKPRDAWKYGNLYRNALAVVYANPTYNVAANSVLIVSPVWMDQFDQQAGGVQGQEIWFQGSGWMSGSGTKGPTTLNHSIDAYSVMDNFTDWLFDKTQFPALNQVVIAGHSMGGQASHRYAVMKKQKTYDDNMSYWVGNPGSWTYLSPQRPYWNDSCADTYDSYEYGIGQNLTKIPKYARKDIIANNQSVVERYLNRKVHMALGLLDNGPGDTHCEAQLQGGNHLDRGSQYVLHLANLTGNNTFPSAQTVDFIGQTSHQDYAMISADPSLHWLFVNDYNTRYPDIDPVNPGHVHKDKNATAPPKPHSYATHGNEVLATGLLGGSLAICLVVFALLPFIFTANFDERSFDADVAFRKDSITKSQWNGAGDKKNFGDVVQVTPSTPSTPRGYDRYADSLNSRDDSTVMMDTYGRKDASDLGSMTPLAQPWTGAGQRGTSPAPPSWQQWR